ncbi:CapA family protein [Paenibacillus filicis]|uniref:CapA family protein n=1 Tax=Paenibacillus filicis TaxID=669464 RepID=A0ABU9DC03_9BACL
MMIESRTEKRKTEKQKKDRKTLGIKIALLSVITMGAFAYLIQWLETRQPQGSAVAESPVASPKPPAASSALQQPAGTTTGDKQADDEGKPAQSGPETGKQADKVSMTFVGDVMFAGKVEDLLTKNGYDYPFKYVKPYLEKADITIANLETPITTRGSAQTKEYVYRSSPLALPELKKAGVDVVNLANNHSMDYGEEGLLDTLDHLDEQGFIRVGAGRDAEEAYKYAIVEHQGMKVAFLGFTRVLPEVSWLATAKKPGLAAAHSNKLSLEAIAKARQEADLVVVIAHWGEERNPRPVKTQTDLAHEFIDSGADLVIASHPHVLQGFEQYKGKWVAYSLGNFIFTTNDVPETWESLILNATCTKERKCEMDLVPILTKWAQPIRMVEDQGRQLFEKLTRNSINAKINGEGVVALGPVNTFPPLVNKPPVNKESGVTGTNKPAQGTTDNAKKNEPAEGSKGQGTKKPADSAGTGKDKEKTPQQPGGKSGGDKDKGKDTKESDKAAGKTSEGSKSSSTGKQSPPSGGSTP